MLLLGGCTDDSVAPEAGPGPVETTSSPTAEPTPTESPEEQPPGTSRRLRALGHEDFNRAGFTGDVWALGDHAYVGSYGGKTEDAACPEIGVRVVDIADPARPRAVARIETSPNTTSEDVVAQEVSTERFEGSLLATGSQLCNVDEEPDPEAFRGLEFFDVTDPERPRALSRWRLPGPAAGCHEIDLIARRERVLAACAAPFGKGAGIEEAYIVDVSDPSRPREVVAWSLDEGPGEGVGCLPAKVVHNVRFSADARRAYLSYWDAGTVILDIAKLDRPRVAGRVEAVPGDPDGDNHSVAEVGRYTLITLHEDFSPALSETHFGGCGTRFGAWGTLRIFDISRPQKPRLISEFRTQNSKKAEMTTPEIFTVHNAEVVGDHALASWYSDGVRWLDLSVPSKPREIDGWVPPAAADPHGFLPRVPLIWGVYALPERDLVLATDLNSGLWVLEAPGLGGD